MLDDAGQFLGLASDTIHSHHDFRYPPTMTKVTARQTRAGGWQCKVLQNVIMLDEEDGSLLHCMAWRLAVGILYPSAVSIRVHSFEQRSNYIYTPFQYIDTVHWSKP